jgi:hypothetical protein
MKTLSRMISAGSGLALILFATPVFATVVGHLSNNEGASVSVTKDGILFSDNDSWGGYSGSGGGGGVSAPNSRFSNSSWSYSGGSSSGSSGSDSSGSCDLVSIGQSCTLEIGSLSSPITLTYMGSGKWQTSGDSTALLSVSNGTWFQDLPGLFIDENSDSTSLRFVKSGYSGGTVAPADPAPEPRSTALIAFGGLGIAFAALKLRKVAF